MADICSATDEAAVTMAPSWRKLILPRRGGPPIPIRPVDEDAVARIRKTTFETRRADIEAMLAYHRTFPETAEAGRRYLAGQPDPLGAAAAARLNLLDGIKPADYADLWICGSVSTVLPSLYGRRSSWLTGLLCSACGVPPMRPSPTYGATSGSNVLMWRCGFAGD